MNKIMTVPLAELGIAEIRESMLKQGYSQTFFEKIEKILVKLKDMEEKLKKEIESNFLAGNEPLYGTAAKIRDEVFNLKFAAEKLRLAESKRVKKLLFSR